MTESIIKSPIEREHVMTTPATTVRPLWAIARDVRQHWAKVNFGAVPYLDAMSCLSTLTEAYGMDRADDIVRYFLSNANTWRGEDAKRVKAELKAMLKDHDGNRRR